MKIISISRTVLLCLQLIIQIVFGSIIIYAPELINKSEYYNAFLMNMEYDIIKSSELFKFIVFKSSEYHIPVTWFLALIKVESNGRIKAVSRLGAIGLCQIMEDLANDYGYNRRDLYNPYINISIALMFINKIYHKYNDLDVTLAIYLCGELAYKRNPGKIMHISRHYRNKIMKIYKEYQ